MEPHPHRTTPFDLGPPEDGATTAKLGDCPDGQRVEIRPSRERRCQNCDGVITEPKRYRYCSSPCAEEARKTQNNERRSAYFAEYRRAKNPPSKYWTKDQRKAKSRDYSARYRARQRRLKHVAVTAPSRRRSDADHSRGPLRQIGNKKQADIGLQKGAEERADERRQPSTSTTAA